MPAKHPTLKRFEQALARRRRWDPLLTDCYELTQPQSGSPAVQDFSQKEENRGEKRGIEVFDGTAEDSIREASARDHGQLAPPFTAFANYEAVIVSGAEVDESLAASKAEEASEKVQEAVQQSNLDTEIQPALRDSKISIGGLEVFHGTPEDPFRHQAIPVCKIVPEESADGVARTNFRAETITYRHLQERWPEGWNNLPQVLRNKAWINPEDKIKVVDAQVYDPDSGNYVYQLFLYDGEKVLLEEVLTAPRVILFREDKVAGETMGRGPVVRVLPDIKTLNKAVELTLKNASIAVTGIWQADDDGVINVDNIDLSPGTIIPKAVGSAGLQPLDSPGDLNLANIVVADLQERIRRAILGPALPPVDEGTRTAFELAERRADQLAVEMPRTLRLIRELVMPLQTRWADILQHPAMAASPYYIQPLEGVRLVPLSMAETLQKQAKADRDLGIHINLLTLHDGNLDAIRRLYDPDQLLREYLETQHFSVPLKSEAETDQADTEAAAGAVVEQLTGVSLGGNQAAVGA